MRLVFDKFDAIGSIYGLFHWLIQHDMQLPIRARCGATKGQLQWHRPSIGALAQVLRHPIYAGAYSYGRRPTDPKRKFSPSSNYRPWVPMEQWKVLLKDHLPAYITWEQFLKNRERIKQNQNAPDTTGAPRWRRAFARRLGVRLRSFHAAVLSQKRRGALRLQPPHS